MNIGYSHHSVKSIPSIRILTADPSGYAVRYVIDRYGVSPSLATTIVALARLGGR